LRKGHGGPAGFSRYDTKYESAGVDFYVPHKLLARAKAVLPQTAGEMELEDTLPQNENDAADAQPQNAGAADSAPGAEREGTPQKSPAKRVIGIILFLAVMAAVIFGVDAVMNIFRGMMGY
jgi:hypothetical protein